MMSVFCLLIFSISFGMYHPRTGRFLQQDSLGTKPEIVFTDRGPRIIGTKGPYVPNPNDPMGSLNQYIDGMNLYEYVKSNPIMLTDPIGGCSGEPSLPIPPDVPMWIVEQIINGSASNVAGAVCASQACERGLSSSQVSGITVSTAFCMDILDKAGVPFGIPGNSTSILDACAEECTDISKSDDYKKNCLNECE